MSEEMTELESLKERADQMGLKYHPRTGVEKLKKAIDAKLSGTDEAEEAPVKLSSRAKRENVRKDTVKRMGKLVRIVLSCNDPQYAERGGILKEVGNSYGSFKKYIPFGKEFHVPKVIVDHLRACTYTKSTETKNPSTGRKGVKYTTAKQFVIDVLEPLTEQEIKDLAASQARSGSLED